MAARIASEPISIAASVTDARPRQASIALRQAVAEIAPVSTAEQQPQPSPPTVAELLPLPAKPPGEAFAAAVLSGQLSPKPVTPREIALRLGSAWSPPGSDLHLTDRQV